MPGGAECQSEATDPTRRQGTHHPPPNRLADETDSTTDEEPCHLIGKVALLAECEVAPAIFERVVPRWERFMEPFVASLGRRERAEHALTFVQGLLSDLSHKNVESIAYRFGQERLPLRCVRAQRGVRHAGGDFGVGRRRLAGRTRTADRSRAG